MRIAARRELAVADDAGVLEDQVERGRRHIRDIGGPGERVRIHRARVVREREV